MVVIETIREHAWRFLMDWPLLMGRKPFIDTFQSIQRILTDLGLGLCPRGCCWSLGGGEEYSEPAEVLPALDELERLLRHEMIGGESHRIANWENWRGGGAIGWLLELIEAQNLQALGVSDVAPLPRLALAELDARLAEDASGEFVSRPRWHGHTYETGPIVRMASHPIIASLTQRYGRGLLARVVARLLELLELPAHLRDRVITHPATGGVEKLNTAPNIGLSCVETARGLLLHRVELDGERIRRYQVVAPTEWNFHPDGPLVRGLHGLIAENPKALKRLASMSIVALDPCVGYHVTID